MTRDLPVVVLAGGEGRRIGGEKPRRMLGGRRLIDRALELARSWSDRVAVAVREDAGEIAAPILIDDPAITGPLGGVAAALRHGRALGAEAVLIVPCDAPFVPADLSERLGAAIGDHAAAIAASGGELHPVCGLWRVAASDRLEAYLGSDRRSLWGFAEAVGFVAVEWPCVPIDPFFNVNNEEDMARAEALLREAGQREL